MIETVDQPVSNGQKNGKTAEEIEKINKAKTKDMIKNNIAGKETVVNAIVRNWGREFSDEQFDLCRALIAEAQSAFYRGDFDKANILAFWAMSGANQQIIDFTKNKIDETEPKLQGLFGNRIHALRNLIVEFMELLEVDDQKRIGFGCREIINELEEFPEKIKSMEAKYEKRLGDLLKNVQNGKRVKLEQLVQVVRDLRMKNASEAENFLGAIEKFYESTSWYFCRAI